MKNRSAPNDQHNEWRSPCPIANALDLIGDRWTLLVVRDLLGGGKTFGEIHDSPEGIPTNILSDRLKRMEEAGLISSSAYQERPRRYRYSLTPKGEGLDDVIGSLYRWGKRSFPGTRMLEHVQADLKKRRAAANARRKNPS
ncbi:MAG: winged helix-turn-helix transcriptional regulator [Burkholderiales bacterium]